MLRALQSLLLLLVLATGDLAHAQKGDGSRLALFKKYYAQYSATPDRVQAVLSLLDCDEPGVFEVLYPKLGEKGVEHELTKAIVQVFARFRSEAQRKQVLDALASDRPDPGRLALLQAICDGGWKEAAGILPRLLSDKSAEMRCRVLARLSVDDAALAEKVAPLCEDADDRVRFEALDALARFRSPLVVPKAIAALEHESRQVRQSAIHALSGVRHKSAVEPLIRRLQKEKGLLVVDLAEALAGLTGNEFGPDPARWSRWWAEQDPLTYELPSIAGIASLRGRREARSGGSGWEFPPTNPGTGVFELKTASRQMVFVIDCSASMAALVTEKERYDHLKPADFSRMEIVKAELTHVIERLPQDARFNIIAFGTDLDPWKKGLQQAVITVKSSAKDWIKGLHPIDEIGKGKTNTFGALRLALGAEGVRSGAARDEKSEPDTVFFLSDGRPTCGDYVDPADILSEIRALNERSRIVIHTLAIGEFEKDFMKRLAEQNGPGQFLDLGK